MPILRRRLKAQDIDSRWHALRQCHGSQLRVTAVFQRPHGHTLHVRKATRPEGKHLEVCQVLVIDTQPGGIEKLIH